MPNTGFLKSSVSSLTTDFLSEDELKEVLVDQNLALVKQNKEPIKLDSDIKG